MTGPVGGVEGYEETLFEVEQILKNAGAAGWIIAIGFSDGNGSIEGPGALKGSLQTTLGLYKGIAEQVKIQIEKSKMDKQ